MVLLFLAMPKFLTKYRTSAFASLFLSPQPAPALVALQRGRRSPLDPLYRLRRPVFLRTEPQQGSSVPSIETVCDALSPEPG